MSLQLLLSQIGAISEKYDHLYRKTGQYFNIFEIARISSAEVTICRVIHELINPHGRHHQGDVYLRLFVKHVLDLNLSEEDYSTATVFREYPVKQDRRIDLVIKTRSKLVPIEVKIYARDQDVQCEDYVAEAKNSDLYYLTLYGTPPSVVSVGCLETTNDQDGNILSCKGVKCISFKHHITEWLEHCLRQEGSIRIASIREVLLQLLGVVRKLTNQMEEGKDMEITKMITSSTANMRSAIEIAQSLEGCKVDMMRRVLKAMEECIGQRGLFKQKLANKYDYESANGKLLNDYYKWKGSTHPGISYCIRSLDQPGAELWFRVEIHDRIFAGFCTPVNGDKGSAFLGECEMAELLPGLSPRIDEWWIYWEYLDKDEMELSPDFKQLDEPYLRLFDATQFDLFISRSVERIENMLSRLTGEPS